MRLCFKAAIYMRRGRKMEPKECFLGEKYVLKGRIGQGGTGTVYLAYDRRLHKKWAVKELSLTGKSVEAELLVLQQADHRNLPRIVDVLKKGGKTYLVMDYIEGESLSERLARTGSLSSREVLRYGCELSSVLQYLHSLKPPVIYRDMKPSNIMLRRDGSAVLIDFGTAKRYAGDGEDTTALGTRKYASPEQFSGKSDMRSDIYALGATLAECLNGKERSRESVKLCRIIDKCMEENPRRRYQTSHQLFLAFERLAEQQRRRENRKFPVAAAVAVCLIGVSAAVLSRGTGDAETGSGSAELALQTVSEGQTETESEQYQQKIREILNQKETSWKELSFCLSQFSEYNQNLSNQEERLQNAVFIAGIYMSYENYLEEAFERAAVVLRLEENAWNQEENGSCMEEREECLVMLSAIFRLLGRREPENKETYYRKAIDYTEKLFCLDGVREDNVLYGRKSADAASMLEEIGEWEAARAYYLRWESECPGRGKEGMDIYLGHIRNLLEDGAEEQELERLIREAEKIEGMKDDARFQRMEKRFRMDYGSSAVSADSAVH